MKAQPTLVATVLGAALVLAPALGWAQPSSPSQDDSVKHDLKTAGHDTKDATIDAAHDVKKGTVKAAHATETGTKKAAHGTRKVWDKTKNTTRGAVHGAKEGAEKKSD